MSFTEFFYTEIFLIYGIKNNLKIMNLKGE